MKVLWLPEALADLERLYDFLQAKDAAAAERALGVIETGADRLLQYPRIGQPMDDDSERRQLFLPFGGGSYVLRYRLHRDSVVILRVWHSREDRG